VLLVFWVLALAGAGYVLVNSPFFWVRSVQVLGCSRVAPGEVAAASGVAPGVNIFTVPLGEVAERVAAIPWVAEATCMRLLPGTIRISVVERTPVAATPRDGRFVVLDGDCWAVDIWESPGGLPLVTEESEREIVVGRQVDSQPLQWAVECAAAFGPRSGDVAEIHADDESFLTVYMVGGLRVVLGRGDSTLENKVGILVGILNDIEERGLDAEYVDLRFEKPVVKKREGR
jgi:cell division protein FtsQ